MTQNHRLVIQVIEVPILRPLLGDLDRWQGVAHRLPVLPVEEGEEGPRPLFEWARGVRFADAATGIVFEVVPGDGATPRHYSETAIRGALPPDPPPLSRLWLNARARLYLAQHEGPHASWGATRPHWESEQAPERVTRPDDATLVALVVAAYESGESPRQTLHREFGVKPNTADDWIKRARAVAHEHEVEIPAPTRGRGHKRASGDRS